MLEILPCLDSTELAVARQSELDVSRGQATELGRSAVQISEQGFYDNVKGIRVDIRDAVQMAQSATRSLSPDEVVISVRRDRHSKTRVQVTNESTMGAALRLIRAGMNPLALNFASGIHPGGGFLKGSRAQEETLCRSSALYLMLKGDRMYQVHRERSEPDSTDWCIYSPNVPVFRTDAGELLEHPWQMSVITCAAPYAPDVGQPRSGDLLQKRILRIMEVAHAFNYSCLILGAWGCGAFRNDTERTARDFRSALEGEFAGAFSEVVFAITDWSPERKFLGPFRDVFR